MKPFRLLMVDRFAVFLLAKLLSGRFIGSGNSLLPPAPQRCISAGFFNLTPEGKKMKLHYDLGWVGHCYMKVWFKKNSQCTDCNRKGYTLTQRTYNEEGSLLDQYSECIMCFYANSQDRPKSICSGNGDWSGWAWQWPGVTKF